MKYIIASVEGVRKDLAPEYTGEYGKLFKYGSFYLIIAKFGDYENEKYEKAYKEISDYCKKVNNELQSNKYFKGWMYAEMLTPNERNEYNGIRCKLFHTWFVDKMINAEEIIVHKTHITGKDIDGKINVYDNPIEVMKIVKAVSSEMLDGISLPGEYDHNVTMTCEDNIFVPNHPIFKFGYNLPYSIQIIDDAYSSAFKEIA